MFLKISTLFFLIASIIDPNAEANVLTFRDEDFFGLEADRIDWTRHPCRRACLDGAEPQVCKYVFVVEKLSSMSKACYNCPFNMSDCYRPHCIPTDGFEKPVYVVNRQLPGPLIEACQNDWIVVEVRNRMLSDSLVIHWHGFKHFGTPFFDGVPFVSQCPVLPGTTFQYYFNATTTGTFFWHSHIGAQRSDGFFGPMVINDVHSEDLFVDQYDYDIHRLIVTEWKHRPGDVDVAHDNYVSFNTKTETILINGRGRYVNFTDEKTGKVRQTPLEVFRVQPGKKYRFRVIDAGSENCPLEGSIDNHTLQIIALDSKYIKPVKAEVITMWAGERVDFILHANQEPGNYYFRWRALGRCRSSKGHQEAIIHYTNVALDYPDAPVGYQYPIYNEKTRVLNPYDAGTESDPSVNITIPNLTAMDTDDLSSHAEVDQQFFIVFDAYAINNYDYQRKHLYGITDVTPDHRATTLQFNHISLKMPEFPLNSQWQQLDPETLCNSTHIPIKANCTADQCACTHVVNVKLNTVAEIVLITEGIAAANHPLHLHGHFFRVVASEKVGGKMSIDRFIELDKAGKVVRKLHQAPIKDTMKTPVAGYTIIRFLANNPGYWLFHCHFEPHLNVGMGLVFKVGEHEDFPPVPKDFPTCGAFAPEDFRSKKYSQKHYFKEDSESENYLLRHSSEFNEEFDTEDFSLKISSEDESDSGSNESSSD